MKRIVHKLVTIVSFSTIFSSVFGQNCSELFFSEYIEGSGSNKAVEIYNPSNTTIDLSSYTVKVISNGGPTTSNISLSGMLAPNDVFVITNINADAALKDSADLSTGSLNFNGDDAVLLVNATDTIDVIGVIGTDPGSSWTGANGATTQNQTLVRMSNVQIGVGPDSSNFNPSLEWVNSPQDDFSNIGFHNSSCHTNNCVATSAQITDSICEGESYPFNDTSLTTAGVYFDTIPNSGGCDSIIELTLSVNTLPIVSAGTDQTIQNGESVTLNGSGATIFSWNNGVDDGVAFMPTQTADYIVTGLDDNGCLNTDTVTVTVQGAQQPNIANCSELFFSEYIEGSSLNKAIEIYNPSSSSIDLSNYQVLIFGNGQTNASITVPLTGTLAADSVFIIAHNGAVQSLKDEADLLFATLDFNGDDAVALVSTTDTIDVIGIIGNDPGTAWTGGSASTQNQTLVRIASVEVGVGNDSTNFDPSIEWANSPQDDFSNIGMHTSNCPRCVNDTTILNEGICVGESFPFKGQQLTLAGQYIDTLQNAGGCDSIIELNLIVNQLPMIAAASSADTVCVGQDFVLFGQGGTTYTWDNNVTDSVVTSITSVTTFTVSGVDTNGCVNTDSIVVAVNNDTIPEIVIFTADSLLCEGEGTSFTSLISNEGQTFSYQWKRNGNNVGTGLATYTSQSTSTNDGDIITCELTTTNACASTVVSNAIIISVGTPDTVNLIQSICQGDSVQLGNQNLVTSGSYTETLQNINGCDSVVNLTLTVNANETSLINDTICEGTPYIFKGDSLTESGTYVDTLQTTNGCDSTVTLSLTVNPIQLTTSNAFICSGDSVLFDGAYINTSGTYVDTLTALSGCDSISVLDLIVGGTDTLMTADIICSGDSVVFGTQTLMSSGIYTEVFTSVGGCDSIVSVELEVVNSTASQYGDTICANSSVEFSGQQLSEAGVYFDTLINAAGCDSIVTFNLTVLPSYLDTLTQVICNGDSLLFGGVYYNQDGVYTQNLQTINGCDSTVILDLTIKNIDSVTINESICNGATFTLGAQTITQAGTYVETFQSSFGCDSVVTAIIGIGNSTDTSVVAEICQGDFYEFGGQVYTSTGTYTNTFTNISGCDSIVELTLQVKVKPIVSITQSGETLTSTAGEFYQWFFNGDTIVGATDQTYVPTENGIYTVEMTAFNGCSDLNNYTFQNVGVEEALAINLNVKPNPSNGLFIISASESLEYVVYNLLGEIVGQSFESKDSHSINLTSNENGVYILKITTVNNSIITKRLIKN